MQMGEVITVLTSATGHALVKSFSGSDVTRQFENGYQTTTHHHLYLPKDYSGSPTTSIYAPWTEAEVLTHLATGWGEGAITELKLEYLYGPEPEVSG